MADPQKHVGLLQCGLVLDRDTYLCIQDKEPAQIVEIRVVDSLIPDRPGRRTKAFGGFIQ